MSVDTVKQRIEEARNNYQLYRDMTTRETVSHFLKEQSPHYQQWVAQLEKRMGECGFKDKVIDLPVPDITEQPVGNIREMISLVNNNIPSLLSITQTIWEMLGDSEGGVLTDRVLSELEVLRYTKAVGYHMSYIQLLHLYSITETEDNGTGKLDEYVVDIDVVDIVQHVTDVVELLQKGNRWMQEPTLYKYIKHHTTTLSAVYIRLLSTSGCHTKGNLLVLLEIIRLQESLLDILVEELVIYTTNFLNRNTDVS